MLKAIRRINSPLYSAMVFFRNGNGVVSIGLRLKKIAIIFSGIFLFAFVLFLLADQLAPIPVNNKSDYARVITARDGTPLRTFADKQGVWRYPVKLSEVSPRYIKTLLAYEDRWFWHHPGVNPLAIIRAMIQNFTADRIISGGSTITMQVARILDPHSRTVNGKLKQIFRALQLEWHFDKSEILTLYINKAPFGGPLEGVQAASFAYLSKSARELSQAEAALLTVLPQSPSRFRPDRHPERATRARNKVLQRLVKYNALTQAQADDARLEIVVPQLEARPMLAPVLAQRLKHRVAAGKVLKTTIDANLQITFESLVKNYTANLPDKTSAAILVVDHTSLEVKSYVASADFFDQQRYGQVDMIRAIRSPGSTLKPFLYGMAIDQGLIHSHSLLIDAPGDFSGYRPQNFSQGFSGPVSVSEALQRSLNVPAVQVMQFLGPNNFVATLANSGMSLSLPQHGKPNLSIALGGVGVRLEELVSAYTAFSRQGLAGKLRYSIAEPVIDSYLFSAGAAWIIRDILSRKNTRGHFSGQKLKHRNLAWKTGTSYGYRDAWVIGMSGNFTIGIWLGRPDGTPMPGQYGAVTAVPLLLSVVENLPPSLPGYTSNRPESVTQKTICWPTGEAMEKISQSLCHQQQTAWIVDNTIPPSLAATDQNMNFSRYNVTLSKTTGLLVNSSCKLTDTEPKQLALWPLSLEPWLAPEYQRNQQVPAMDPRCFSATVVTTEPLKIISIKNSLQIKSPTGLHQPISVNLQSQGGSGPRLWFVNGQPVNQQPTNAALNYTFLTSGEYQISAVDTAGNIDKISLSVSI